MVTNVQNTGAAADIFASLNGKPATSAASAAGATQDRFLTLLVTQMKNQDPLNPMDNAQVTSQMAQLSTVTGIDKLNATLQALSDNMMSNQSMQAANMIGHGVLIPGNSVSLSNSQAFGGVELTQSVDKMDISIYDQSGALVRTVNLGPQAVGTMNWQWDGRDNAGNTAADGQYSFQVNASQGGVPIDTTALQFGMVNGVSQGKGTVTLSVGNTDGIAVSDVRQIV